jgi:TolB-like protein/tetratricopeptide (TPR) repeat protein
VFVADAVDFERWLQHGRVHLALVRDELGADADPAVASLIERLRSTPAVSAVVAQVTVPASADGSPYREERGGAEGRVDDAAQRSQPDPLPHRASSRTAVSRGVVGLAAAALVVAVSIWPRTVARTTEGSSQDALAKDSLVDGRMTIAVLPFANYSGATENEYFGDGLSEELISMVGRSPGLRVAARTSAFAFKGQHLDVRELGQRLGVSMLVEGSVRRADDRVRIDARLVRAADRYVLWSETYDREAAHTLALQEEIARRVADALRVRIDTIVDGALASSADPVIHTLYLKGRYVLSSGGRTGLTDAIRYFDEVIARDSTHAGAYAALAEAYAQQGNAGTVPHAIAHPRARAAAERAIALDPSVAEAHTALAYVLASERRFTAAEESFERAIAIAPSYAPARHQFGFLLTALGRLDEGMRELRAAQALDPLSVAIGVAVERALVYARDYDAAILHYRELLPLASQHAMVHFGLGLAYGERGDRDAAIRAAQRALELSPSHTGALAVLAAVHARAGERREATRILEQLVSRPEPLAHFYAGAIHSLLGDTDAALAQLERVSREEPSWLISMRVEPWLDRLRSESRYRALERRVGLAR